eukprot:scaffold6102_cov107-Isochrysis_galbana.AAC.1
MAVVMYLLNHMNGWSFAPSPTLADGFQSSSPANCGRGMAAVSSRRIQAPHFGSGTGGGCRPPTSTSRNGTPRRSASHNRSCSTGLSPASDKPRHTRCIFSSGTFSFDASASVSACSPGGRGTPGAAAPAAAVGRAGIAATLPPVTATAATRERVDLRLFFFGVVSACVVACERFRIRIFRTGLVVRWQGVALQVIGSHGELWLVVFLHGWPAIAADKV